MTTTTPPLPYFKVLKQPVNGLKIAGRKGRKLNDVIQVAERLVRFQVLEGILAPCDAQGTLTGSGSSGSGSSGS